MTRVRRNTKLYTIVRQRQARHQRTELERLRDLARARPNDAKVRFRLAVTLDRMGREAEAIPHYHRALRLNPHHPHAAEIFLYLASSYRKTGRPAAAQRYLDRAEAMGANGELQRRLRRLLRSPQ